MKKRARRGWRRGAAAGIQAQGEIYREAIGLTPLDSLTGDIGYVRLTQFDTCLAGGLFGSCSVTDELFGASVDVELELGGGVE